MNNLLKLFPQKGLSSPATDPIGKGGAQVWFRADTVILTGSNVLGWVDKSGNGRLATIGGTGVCTWNPTGLNGNATVTFPGGTTPPYFMFGGTTPILPIGSAGATIVVMKSNGVPLSGFGSYLSLVSDGIGAFCAMFTSNVAGYSLYSLGGGANPGSNIGNSFDPSAQWNGFVNNYSGAGNFSNPAQWNVYANNSLQTLSVNLGAVNTVGAVNSYMGIFTPSGTIAFEGSVAEVIVYNSQLTSPELSSMHSYLNARYGAGVG